MTVKEFEELAIGLETGYFDRNGTPIRVGDQVVYYKKCTKRIGLTENIRDYPIKYIVGDGAQGFVYTGKVMRQRNTVTFSFMDGIAILDGRKWKYLHETDASGNLVTILVDNENKNPKLSLDEVISPVQVLHKSVISREDYNILHRVDEFIEEENEWLII